MKNILIVGWGTETAKLILEDLVKLEDFNFYLATTKNIAAEIKVLFDDEKIVYTNPYDGDKLIDDVVGFLNKKQIRFKVVTTFFEMCVEQTACLAEALKLKKSLPVEAARRTSVNKFLMREALRKGKTEQPKYLKFGKNSLKEAYAFLKKSTGGVVVKPVHSGHSYGVRFVENSVNFGKFEKVWNEARGDLVKNYDEWMKYEKPEREFLMEEYLEGKIYSFDGIVGDKNVGFIGNTEFDLSSPPVLQQIGSTTPIYSLNKRQMEESKKYVEKVVGCLGLKYCGFHAEIKYTDEPILIEIAGRLPGGVVTKAYQDISPANIYSQFLAIFFEGMKIEKNKNKYVAETMKIIFADREVGVVENKIISDGGCQIRARKDGERVREKHNPFGVWLADITLKSDKMKGEKLVKKRDRLLRGLPIRLKFDWWTTIRSYVFQG